MGSNKDVVGAVAIVAGAAAGKTLFKCIMGRLDNKIDSSVKKCPHCGKEFGLFRWRYTCDICGETVCDDCLSKYEFKYCSKCMMHVDNNIETYPATYQGNKYKPCTEKGAISTNWFDEKEDALEELKMRAAILGCNVVYNVRYDKDTGRNGNYIYSIWQAIGIAAIKTKQL